MQAEQFIFVHPSVYCLRGGNVASVLQVLSIYPSVRLWSCLQSLKGFSKRFRRMKRFLLLGKLSRMEKGSKARWTSEELLKTVTSIKISQVSTDTKQTGSWQQTYFQTAGVCLLGKRDRWVSRHLRRQTWNKPRFNLSSLLSCWQPPKLWQIWSQAPSFNVSLAPTIWTSTGARPAGGWADDWARDGGEGRMMDGLHLCACVAERFFSFLIFFFIQYFTFY